MTFSVPSPSSRPHLDYFCESIRANRPDSRCELPGHLSFQIRHEKFHHICLWCYQNFISRSFSASRGIMHCSVEGPVWAFRQGSGGWSASARLLGRHIVQKAADVLNRWESKGLMNRGNRTESLWEAMRGSLRGRLSEFFKRILEVFRAFERLSVLLPLIVLPLEIFPVEEGCLGLPSEKKKGQQLKGKIVSALFRTFSSLFSTVHFFRVFQNFSPGLS